MVELLAMAYFNGALLGAMGFAFGASLGIFFVIALEDWNGELD